MPCAQVVPLTATETVCASRPPWPLHPSLHQVRVCASLCVCLCVCLHVFACARRRWSALVVQYSVQYSMHRAGQARELFNVAARCYPALTLSRVKQTYSWKPHAYVYAWVRARVPRVCVHVYLCARTLPCLSQVTVVTHPAWPPPQLQAVPCQAGL